MNLKLQHVVQDLHLPSHNSNDKGSESERSLFLISIDSIMGSSEEFSSSLKPIPWNEQTT